MKTLIYTINILIILLFVSVTASQAAVTSEIKMERFAVLGAWLLFGITMLISYIMWRKKSRTLMQHSNKVRIRTYEIMDHGKRVILAKKLPNNTKSAAKKVA